MEPKKLNRWIENFKIEMETVQITFDAFFIKKKIDNYYNLQVDKEHNNLVLEIIDGDELPNEIVNRITDAYSRSKPVQEEMENET